MLLKKGSIRGRHELANIPMLDITIRSLSIPPSLVVDIYILTFIFIYILILLKILFYIFTLIFILYF
jgi:hypothetical protein